MIDKGLRLRHNGKIHTISCICISQIQYEDKFELQMQYIGNKGEKIPAEHLSAGQLSKINTYKRVHGLRVSIMNYDYHFASTWCDELTLIRNG